MRTRRAVFRRAPKRGAMMKKMTWMTSGRSVCRHLLLLSAIAASAAYADTLRWTGGSATTSNFSDPDNWVSMGSHTIPERGDTLVFSGETRTTPYNDLDPDAVPIAGITFANDNSSGKTASFTITGEAAEQVREVDGTGLIRIIAVVFSAADIVEIDTAKETA